MILETRRFSVHSSIQHIDTVVEHCVPCCTSWLRCGQTVREPRGDCAILQQLSACEKYSQKGTLSEGTRTALQEDDRETKTAQHFHSSRHGKHASTLRSHHCTDLFNTCIACGKCSMFHQSVYVRNEWQLTVFDDAFGSPVWFCWCFSFDECFCTMTGIWMRINGGV